MLLQLIKWEPAMQSWEYFLKTAQIFLPAKQIAYTKNPVHNCGWDFCFIAFDVNIKNHIIFQNTNFASLNLNK